MSDDAPHGPQRRLAVIGRPIAHSLSPAIHGAAYGVLGLPWSYERVEVDDEGVRPFLDGLGAEWLGLSVTAPDKVQAARWCRSLDAAATLTEAANTVRVDLRAGWNTDVRGITRAFIASGLEGARTGAILGGGATAASALMGLAELGAEHVTVQLRSHSRLDRLQPIAERLGVRLVTIGLDDVVPAVDAVVSTYPAAADVSPVFAVPPARLLDADYASAVDRFPALDAERLIPGVEMLLHQALAQVRIFVAGDPEVSVPAEADVWQAMRGAVAEAQSPE